MVNNVGNGVNIGAASQVAGSTGIGAKPAVERAQGVEAIVGGAKAANSTSANLFAAMSEHL